ncbi:MAG: 2-keto-4-pentenoate hydratase [Sedimentisphaerales bacterium]
MRRMRIFAPFRVSVMVLATILAVATAHQAFAKDSVDVGKMVKEMLTGRKMQTQIPYLTQTYGSFSMDKAYQIQATLAKKLSKRLGPVVGYKVAYASKAAQQQFGVNEPASGPLFLLQRLPSGSNLPASAFMELLIETEIAFTLSKRIDRLIKDVTEIKDYVRWVHAAFDLSDERFVEGKTKPTAQDSIANGVGAHFFVLGPAVEPGKVDVDTVTLKLIRDGKTIEASPATNVMGSPWNSLLWLANHVVKLGGKLQPGMVVVTGTAAPAYKAKAEAIKGDYMGDCGPLGRVTLTIK